MNAVQKKQVFYIEVQCRSPLTLSSGENEWTDSDLMRDFDGKIFVPGSSLAGAFRSCLNHEKDQPCLMGYAKNDLDGRMSALYLSDLVFTETPQSNIRDNVALSRHKTAISGSKFDFEIVEAGAKGYFYMEYVLRSEEEEQQAKTEAAIIFQGLENGEIRLGSKKTRGFGRLEILAIKEKSFDQQNFLDYAKAFQLKTWEKESDQKQRWFTQKIQDPSMVRITVPLILTGGISIRQYSTRKNEPDFVQLTDHGVPVVSGTSMAGALRHRLEDMLEEIDESVMPLPTSVEKMIQKLFGYVDGDRGAISNVVVSESEISGSTFLTMVRTGISRFESAVKLGALYKERTAVEGNLQLEILMKKQQDPVETETMIGLICLVLKDLQEGFLAVGGQTAIGRGVFAKNGKIRIDGKEDLEDVYISKVCQGLSEWGDKDEA